MVEIRGFGFWLNRQSRTQMIYPASARSTDDTSVALAFKSFRECTVDRNPVKTHPVEGLSPSGKMQERL